MPTQYDIEDTLHYCYLELIGLIEEFEIELDGREGLVDTLKECEALLPHKIDDPKMKDYESSY